MPLVNPNFAKRLDSLLTEFFALRDPEDAAPGLSTKTPFHKPLYGGPGLAGPSGERENCPISPRCIRKNRHELLLQVFLKILQFWQRLERLDLEKVWFGWIAGKADKRARKAKSAREVGRPRLAGVPF